MKTIMTLTSIALLSISCTKQETPSEAPSTTQTQTAIPYPLDTCLVSGEKIGSMGDPVVIVHEGQEIKFCCDSCIPKFNKNPAKYLAALDAVPGE